MSARPAQSQPKPLAMAPNRAVNAATRTPGSQRNREPISGQAPGVFPQLTKPGRNLGLELTRFRYRWRMAAALGAGRRSGRGA